MWCTFHYSHLFPLLLICFVSFLLGECFIFRNIHLFFVFISYDKRTRVTFNSMTYWKSRNTRFVSKDYALYDYSILIVCSFTKSSFAKKKKTTIDFPFITSDNVLYNPNSFGFLISQHFRRVSKNRLNGLYLYKKSIQVIRV